MLIKQSMQETKSPHWLDVVGNPFHEVTADLVLDEPMPGVTRGHRVLNVKLLLSELWYGEGPEEDGE